MEQPSDDSRSIGESPQGDNSIVSNITSDDYLVAGTRYNFSAPENSVYIAYGHDFSSGEKPKEKFVPVPAISMSNEADLAKLQTGYSLNKDEIKILYIAANEHQVMFLFIEMLKKMSDDWRHCISVVLTWDRNNEGNIKTEHLESNGMNDLSQIISVAERNRSFLLEEGRVGMSVVSEPIEDGESQVLCEVSLDTDGAIQIYSDSEKFIKRCVDLLWANGLDEKTSLPKIGDFKHKHLSVPHGYKQFIDIANELGTESNRNSDEFDEDL